MRFVLKFKHWQMFIILLIATFLTNLTWYGHDTITMIFQGAGFLIYFVWFFAIGIELVNHLPSTVDLSNTLFVINGFVIIISFGIIIVFFGGQYSGNGILSFLLISYLIFAIFHFMFYPAKLIKSIELEKEAHLGQYFIYFLQLIFWPIGIWWIQPRINKIEASS